MSTLENGVYAITNNAGNRHVGRFPIEELTLLPKPLMALPRGVEGPNFMIQRSDKGYNIKTFGAPTGVWRNSVSAFLLEADKSQDWIITAQRQHGENVYTIERPERGVGWVVDEEEGPKGSQVYVKPLSSAKNQSPQSQFLPNELFNFVKIDRK
ncbi:hypothetical protein QCA50_004084 [Cerrena zonata]|uniref:Uncharacterized protein n=1 Tax=Cerrena zonata TaxID=2478898 RepID=A0AAW0GKY7_9APHY